MTIVDLTKEDEKILRKEFLQVLYMVLLIALATIFFLVIMVYIINDLENELLAAYRNTVLFFVIAIPGLICSLYAYGKLGDSLTNLSSGKKEVVIYAIDNKITNTKWGWHNSIPLDFVSKPRLYEYVLEIHKEYYFIEKQFYQLVEIGDKVEVSFALPNRRFISIRSIVG